MLPYLHKPSIAAPDADEYVGILLDEWDTRIAEFEQALRDAAPARRDLELTREPIAIIEAETLLAAEGCTEAERRARAVLALHRHDGWRGHRQVARAARLRVREAQRRAIVARMRAELVRAALSAALGRVTDRV